MAETNNQVSRDIFIDLSDEPLLLKDYITIERKKVATFIVPVARFSENL